MHPPGGSHAKKCDPTDQGQRLTHLICRTQRRKRAPLLIWMHASLPRARLRYTRHPTPSLCLPLYVLLSLAHRRRKPVSIHTGGGWTHATQTDRQTDRSIAADWLTGD